MLAYMGFFLYFCAQIAYRVIKVMILRYNTSNITHNTLLIEHRIVRLRSSIIEL